MADGCIVINTSVNFIPSEKRANCILLIVLCKVKTYTKKSSCDCLGIAQLFHLFVCLTGAKFPLYTDYVTYWPQPALRWGKPAEAWQTDFPPQVPDLHKYPWLFLVTDACTVLQYLLRSQTMKKGNKTHRAILFCKARTQSTSILLTRLATTWQSRKGRMF